jgi:spore coat protein CotH
MGRTASRRRVFPPVLLLASLALAPLLAADAEPTPAKASDAFFAKGTVLRLSIELGEKELDSLRREPRKSVKATLKEGDGVIYRDVAVHVKGAAGSTRSIDDKPGLTLSMRKFEGTKLFHGMGKWHLANSVQDPSYLSELLCGELFRAAGVPASSVAHALVTINGRPRGLYYIKEGYDRNFRRRHFTDPGGNLYDGGFLRDINQPLQRLGTERGVKGQAELKALAAACREKDYGERFKKLEKLLDMDRFISFLCLEVLTCDWDGYPMNRNNYRVYHEPKRDKITFIPSGMDQMFGDVNGPLFPNFQGMVARAVIRTPEGRERYLKRMAEILKKVYRPEALVKRLDELEKRVQPALASVDPRAGRGYANQVQRLRDAVRVRAESIERQLKAAEKEKKKPRSKPEAQARDSLACASGLDIP